MRTPGEDKALIIGLMTGEGDLRRIDKLPEVQVQEDNVHVIWEGAPSRRLLDSTSSCGLCGRDEIQITPIRDCGAMPKVKVDFNVIHSITNMEPTPTTLYTRHRVSAFSNLIQPKWSRNSNHGRCRKTQCY